MESIYGYICRMSRQLPGLPYRFQDLARAGRRDTLYTLFHGSLRSLEEGRRACALEGPLLRCIAAGEVLCELSEQLQAQPLFTFLKPLSRRLKLLFREGAFSRERLFSLGMRLARESGQEEEVKLGMLILGLFENDIAEGILRTLSLHSEFSIYGLTAAEDRAGFNGMAFALAKNTAGYGRLAAMDALQPITPEQRGWLLNNAAADPVTREDGALLCLGKPDMEAFSTHAALRRRISRAFPGFWLMGSKMGASWNTQAACICSGRIWAPWPPWSRTLPT